MVAGLNFRVVVGQGPECSDIHLVLPSERFQSLLRPSPAKTLLAHLWQVPSNLLTMVRSRVPLLGPGSARGA